MTSLSAVIGVDGLKQWFYGAALIIIVAVQPSGLWPWLRGRLKLTSGTR